MSEWISVEERLPERDEKILLTDSKIVSVGLYEISSNGIGRYYAYNEGYVDSRIVTHWMPLPQPPTENTDE